MAVESLTLIVPAYNEEKSIEPALSEMMASAKNAGVPVEFVVVDDGSRDGTPQILDNLAQKNPQLNVVHHKENRMIGGAFLSGLSAAKSSHIMLIPVDNPLSAEKIREFISAAARADVVAGCREERRGYAPWMKHLSGIYRKFCAFIFGLKLRDFTWIALYDRRKISELHPQFTGICIFPELLVKSARRGLVIAEVECPMQERKVGQATVSRISRIIHLFFETLRLWEHIQFQKW